MALSCVKHTHTPLSVVLFCAFVLRFRLPLASHTNRASALPHPQNERQTLLRTRMFVCCFDAWLMARDWLLTLAPGFKAPKCEREKSQKYPARLYFKESSRKGCSLPLFLNLKPRIRLSHSPLRISILTASTQQRNSTHSK